MKTAVLLIVINVIMVSCSSTNKKPTNESNVSSNKDDNKSPALTAPKVRKVWVPEKIEGDKFIEGHYMWILEKTTSWSQ